MARRMFYVDEVRGSSASIHGDTAKHLRKVLRVEEGMKFEVSDKQSIWLAEISGFGKNEVEFSLLEEITPPAPPVRIQLYAALIKFDHFEWLLEKAVELGVERITPVHAMRSDKGLEVAALKRAERWTRILEESGQQCRRVAPPELAPPAELPTVLSNDAAVKLCLDETSGCPPLLAALPDERHASDRVALLVGPEGGWDPRERDAARQSGWRAVTLGPQILRTETAAIAALSIVNAAWLAVPE